MNSIKYVYPNGDIALVHYCDEGEVTVAGRVYQFSVGHWDAPSFDNPDTLDRLHERHLFWHEYDKWLKQLRRQRRLRAVRRRVLARREAVQP
jgi:hypothetical protein